MSTSGGRRCDFSISQGLKVVQLALSNGKLDTQVIDYMEVGG